MAQKISGTQTDIFCNLPQKIGLDVHSAMKRDRGGPAIRVPELLVRAFLPCENESQIFRYRGDFLWFEHRNTGTHSMDRNQLRADKLAFLRRFAIFPEHLDHLPHVGVELFQRSAMGMGTGEAGHVPHVGSCFGTGFDDGGEGSHIDNLSAFVARRERCSPFSIFGRR